MIKVYDAYLDQPITSFVCIATIIDKWAETNALARFNHPHLPPSLSPKQCCYERHDVTHQTHIS